MKTMLMTLTTLLISAGSALAAPGSANPETAGLAVWIFFGFFGLIVATQFIPGMILLGAMLKGLFTQPSTVQKINS
ncbi:hypothetical protein SAMN05660860_02368 [Geoalkalibacter ferrihydriticus]|uniref:Uncharacterized protein n=2 Tax=Geoalkalibacter ferrihydriticus TaxID=392333 RepID=A0A0C2HYZ1_9BACT|nr:hypothetical protein [Geoalkalibacter ferrihydriticus]KIH77972.1 hypothetical protein GFER_05035 [Geoalkalibacter ferrihydriticus DSM 17813]SDM34696.1 hypothetical protein SAMN05660860_02368 [Geoalkalibacter ferrihydriticus]